MMHLLATLGRSRLGRAAGLGLTVVLVAALAASGEAAESSGFVMSLESSSVTVSEGGSYSYTVKLGSAPQEKVTVGIARRSGSTDIAVAPAALVFNSANWFIAQQVTISAAEDEADHSDDTAVIAHTVTTDDPVYVYAALPVANLTVTADDNDAAVVLSTQQLTVAEGGDATYGVKLISEPTGDVTITLTEATETEDDEADADETDGGETDGGEAGADTDADLTVTVPADKTLTFTTDNWHIMQPVTVNAADDDDAYEGARLIVHTASGGGYDGHTVNLTATEAEDPAIALAPADLTVTEGESATYTVRLSTAPAAEVTVALATSGDGSIAVSPASLTFDADDYRTPQTVTVTAAEDDDTDDGTATITHTATSDDDSYSAITATLAVTEDDPDVAVTSFGGGGSARFTAPATTAPPPKAIVLSSSAVSVPEGGAASYKLKLSRQPAGDVTVALAASGDSDITVSPSSLTLTTTNWNTDQTVTLSAADDGDNIQGTATITHTASGGGYSNITETLTATEAEKQPAEVTNLFPVHKGSRVDVNWLAARGATGYDLNYSPDNGASWTRALTNHSGLSYTLTNADSSINYVFAARSVNSHGTSGWTNALSGTPR